MYWFLSKNWSGLLIALIFGAISAALYFGGERFVPQSSYFLEIAGGILAVCSSLLVLGSLFHLVNCHKNSVRHPAPGKKIDVGGYKMHILAEGENHNNVTVVWIPGSHDQGLAFHHLHLLAAKETRSILFDRPGSGWSDPGPFPRRVSLEAKELHTLLAKADEKGPFILAAHSLGGLLAQNFAEMYPEKTAGLLLLDSACPDTTIYTSTLKNNKIPGASLSMWCLTAFGVAWIVTRRMLKAAPKWLTIYKDAIQPLVIGGNCQPKLGIGFISALKSLTDFPLDMVKGDGRLGTLPVTAIIPPVSFEQQLKDTLPLLPQMSEREVRNFIHLRIDAQHQNARLSECGELHFSPEGTTHGFPFETPGFVIDKLHSLMARIKQRAAEK